jgi:hypothetical protein
MSVYITILTRPMLTKFETNYASNVVFTFQIYIIRVFFMQSILISYAIEVWMVF